MSKLSKSGNRRLGKSVANAAIFAAVNATGLTALAATPTATWTGNGGNVSWTTTSNWVGNTIPATGGDITFTGSVNLGTSGTPLNNNIGGGTPTAYNSVTFDSNASSFFIGGNAWAGNLTINQNSSVAQTIQNTTSFPSNSTFTLTLRGTGTGLATYSGNIVDANGARHYQVVKNDSSTWVLTGAGNNYSSGTTISAGTLVVNTGSSTGTGTTAVVGGTLAGGGTVASATMSGGAISFTGTITGALTATGGFWNGLGSVNGTTTVSSGTFTVNGTMGGTSNALLLSSNASLAGTGTINKNVTFSGNNTISSTGTLTLGGTLTVNGTGNVHSTGNVNDTGDTIATGGALQVNGILGGSGTFAIASGGTLTGSGTVNKNATLAGTGVISLGSTGNIAGTLTVTGGNWNGLGSVTGLVSHPNGTFTIGSTADLTANGGYSNTGGTLAAAGSTSLLSGDVSYSGSVTNQTWAGNFNGATSNLLFNVSGQTLTLSNVNDMGGETNIQTGTVRVSTTNGLHNSIVNANGGTLGFLTTTTANIAGLKGSTGIVLTNGSAGVTLTVGNATNVTTYSGVLSGAGSLVKNGGGGALTLTGANNYTGSTTVHTGTLNVGGSIASNTVTIDSGGTLNVSGSIPSTANMLITGNATFSNALQTVNTISGAGTLALTGTAFNVASASSFAGSIAGSGNLVKNTAGTLTLSGTSNYSGTTSVAAGVLKVDGTLDSSGAAVTVTGTGTLAGANGNVNRTVNLNSGGKISPGDDSTANTLNTAAVNMAGGSTYTWNIFNATGSAGSGYDSLNISGALNINATGLTGDPKITIKVIAGAGGQAVSNWNPGVGGQSWTIATASGGVNNFDTSKFVLDTSDFSSSNGTGHNPPFNFQLQQSGNSIRIAYVPEPGSMMMLSCAGLVALARRRRRK